MRVLFIAVTVFWTSAAIAQTEAVWNEQKLDKLRNFLVELNEKKQFNGTVLLADSGKILFHESLGFSDIRTKKKLDQDSSFRLASVSKQFTAMAIMLLREKGLLEYDDKVAKHIPQFPYENVTIRHLLHHTSGLPDYMSFMRKKWDPTKKSKDKKIAFNKDMMAQLVSQKPELVFEPGTKFRYSNTGYVLLGFLIEEVSGQSFRQFIDKSIFVPCEMTNSYVFSPNSDFAPDHRVYGFSYTRSGKGYEENDHHYLNGMIGDGGIYSSAIDLLKWDQALYSEKLVSQKTLMEAFDSGLTNEGEKTGYGFGWSIDKNDGATLQVSHGGAWVGFQTFIGRKISAKRTLIILTNHSSQHLQKIIAKIGELARS